MAAERPSPPLNLNFSDQIKTAVTLTWETPTSNGGSMITGYIIEKCDDGTDKWLRCNARLCPDLSYRVQSSPQSSAFFWLNFHCLILLLLLLLTSFKGKNVRKSQYIDHHNFVPWWILFTTVCLIYKALFPIFYLFYLSAVSTQCPSELIVSFSLGVWSETWYEVPLQSLCWERRRRLWSSWATRATARRRPSRYENWTIEPKVEQAVK